MYWDSIFLLPEAGKHRVGNISLGCHGSGPGCSFSIKGEAGGSKIFFHSPCLWCGDSHCLCLVCVLEDHLLLSSFSSVPGETQPATPKIAELPHLQEITLSCCRNNSASHERTCRRREFQTKADFRHTHTPTPIPECQGLLHMSGLPSIHASIQVLISWSPVLTSLQWHTEDLSAINFSSCLLSFLSWQPGAGFRCASLHTAGDDSD